MEIGIIGLPQSGKTTVFNALSHGAAATGGYGAGKQSNIGIAHVEDPRLKLLTDFYKPRKVVPAEIRYVDIPGQSPDMGKTEGFRGEYLLQVSQVDALLHVVRAFRNDTVPHVTGTIDPVRDVETMEVELSFADLAVVERRLQRVQQNMKAAKPDQRQKAQEETAFLNKLKANLEKDTPVREMEFTDDERKTLANYQFLTNKPILTILNMDEGNVDTAPALIAQLQQKYGDKKRRFAHLCGKVEEELSQLPDEEAKDFRESLGVPEGDIQRVTLKSQELLDLITFFTGGDDEVKAWPITRGTLAPQAAGKIHSDIERGFIRAEVIHMEDLLRTGSEAAARKQGLIRQEGKAYTVKDGDVITFLFNV
jgi:GTP-binding protein YchF